MAQQPVYRAGRHEIALVGEPGAFQPTLSGQTLADGLELVTLRLTSPTPAVPAELRLTWRHPVIDIHGMWTPGGGRSRDLVPDWARPRRSQATSGAPVTCLHNLQGRNRLTFAVSDALHVIDSRSGVHEESAEFICEVRLFCVPPPALQQYEVSIRLDTRDIYYHEALKDVADWWAGMPDMTPSPVPEPARLPMYSTWYSMHQDLLPDQIQKQCRIAWELGCRAVIIDDGWQTTDSGRGYGYCGDWKPDRIPQMKQLVARLHEIGMKVLVWYSVPHAGKHSQAFKRFADKQLFYEERNSAACLDPRFPDVREYLINVYEQAIREWDLDGFKLDFVDWFTAQGFPSRETNIPGRDYAGVPEAVDRLLTDIMARLRTIKPDVMIEFRQSYIGPLMRKYGNMFRAGDCPDAAVTNRFRVLDVRLLCGNTAAHADPIMWNPAEPVESAALQMIHPLFGVPQVSMLLDKLPPDHFQMVKFWLTFWRENRDVIMDGRLHPMYPHAMFPVITSTAGQKLLIAVYEPWVVRPGTHVPEEILIVNGTQDEQVVMDLEKGLGKRLIEVFDCCGRKLMAETVTIDEGLYILPVPPAGLVKCHRSR